MAKLTLYVDSGIRSTIARQHLQKLGIVFDETNVTADPNAIVFLESKERPTKKYPLPQYYVGETLAWENGYKDVINLTTEQINERISEINVS